MRVALGTGFLASIFCASLVLGGGAAIGSRVFGAEVNIGDLFFAVLKNRWELGLNQSFDIGEGLLGMDQQSERLDLVVDGDGACKVFAIVSLVLLNADG